jgi:polysaccharide export outer membrane protein
MRILLALSLLILLCGSLSAQESSYALQPGDTLDVSVLEDPTLNRKLVIGPDGMISFPLAGHFRAAGMTVQTLESALSQRLKKNYKTAPQVTVMLASVTEALANKIYITGEVNKPGPYDISPGTSVMQAIALSGGLGKFAATGRIQVHRRVAGKEEVILFNYDDFTSGKNLEGDIPLQPGDVIVVPERGLFR